MQPSNFWGSIQSRGDSYVLERWLVLADLYVQKPLFESAALERWICSALGPVTGEKAFEEGFHGRSCGVEMHTHSFPLKQIFPKHYRGESPNRCR